MFGKRRERQLQRDRYPNLICSADWHLSAKPPSCREGESDWYATQTSYLNQVKKIAQIDLFYPLPIVVAGDVLDKWDVKPELLNWCLCNMPQIYAISGQHEQPNHSLKDLGKSGYWSLVLADKIRDIYHLNNIGETQRMELPGGVRLHGFPWGVEPHPLEDSHDLFLEVAVVHKYLWVQGTGYHGAPDSGRVAKIAKQFKGYDVVLSGDNHTCFNVVKNGIRFLNAGSLMRRNVDQADYKPVMWVLYSDATVEPRYLDVSADVFEGKSDNECVTVHDFSPLVDGLKQADGEVVDFDEAVTRTLRSSPCGEDVKEYTRELLGRGK